MISISLNENERPVIKRLKSALRKKFNPNSENDIDSAVMLCNYLVAIDKQDEAKGILTSFLYFNYSDKLEKYEHIWPSNAQGLVLLSYIESQFGDKTRQQELANIVVKDDYNYSVNETHFQKILYDYRSNEWNLNNYMNETHKYRCQIIGQENLNFLYWKQTWKYILYYEARRFNDELEKIEGIVDETYSLLREEILHGR